MDKHQLMDLKETELKSKNQKQAFYRYLQIAEHHIFTENKKEGIKILKRLGFKKKTIEAFIENIIRCYEDDEEQMVKEIMMGKVPKRLLN
jgi:Holliday junction resolvasome RuvABC DNA-binding subunit|tara:strand:+ start:167 stop:436 length:270 start_codon:yes stop_codon:yes gene_type:complete